MAARRQHEFSKKEETSEGDIQQRDNVVLRRGIHRAGIGGHPDLEATPENLARNVVLNKMGKMGLIDNCEHVVASGDPIRSETRVFEHENVVLWIRNHSGLILRHLNHGQALERDDSVRHYRSRTPRCFSRAPKGSALKKPLTPIRTLICARPPVAEREAWISPWFRE
jgi:hypothetical protein